MRGLLCLCLCLAAGSCYRDDDWIDPTDMLNYDASAGRMKPPRQSHTENSGEHQHPEEPSQGTCQADGGDCKPSTENWLPKDQSEDIKSGAENALQKCKEDYESLKQEIEKAKMEKGIHQSSCNPVFRRYLHRILNEVQQLGLPGESQPEVHYDAEIVLTKEMVAEVQRFLSDAEWNAGALDEVLSRTLVRFKYHNIEEWRWKLEDFIGIDAFTSFMISLSVLCIIMTVATELWTRVSWFTQIRRLFIVLFVISIGWNWMYLYQVAFAERQAEMTKGGGFDASCGKKVTWRESLYEWWSSSTVFQNDPCEEYFKALMINPILLVPPTKALAVTFTNFITEPLKHMGKGIGEFFHALLAEMPVVYQLPVLIVIAFLLLVFCYGAGTSIPHVNLFRRNDVYRLPAPEAQRPEYNQYIEGGEQRVYHRLQPNPPRYIEGPRNPPNLRPETLHEMDGDFSIPQQEKPQPQQIIRENGTSGQKDLKTPVTDSSFVQQPSEEHTVDVRYVPLQLVKDHSEELSPASHAQQEESLKKGEHVDKSTPVNQRSFLECPTQLHGAGAAENPNQSSAKAVEESETCTTNLGNKYGKLEERRPEETGPDHSGSRDTPMPTSAGPDLAQEAQKSIPVECLLPYDNVNVEDLYTDAGLDGQSESLSFVILENQE